MRIKIGTRGSKLALWQAHFIESELSKAGMDSEIITFETKGDKIQDRNLSKIGSKGVFTEELEAALHEGSIDIAVHSAKDLQSQLEEDLEIIAFTERERANDVLVSTKSVAINKPLIIGTSSTRRVAFLKHYYPNFNIVDLRGNLQTRMQKHINGDCDAMMLAYAGVQRMDMIDDVSHIFSLDKVVPPVGQGSIAIEISNRKIDSSKKTAIREACNHVDTEIRLLAERSFLRTIDGGCSIPVYGYAQLVEGKVKMKAGIISLDGAEKVEFESISEKDGSIKLGEDLANQVLNNGGAKILESIRRNL